MSRLHGVGLRARLALALALVAAMAVGVATLIANRGLERQLEQSAGKRLSAAAGHASRLATRLYRRDPRWSRSALADLGHAAEVGGYRILVEDARGRPVTGQGALALQRRNAVRASVRVAGRRVGTVAVAPVPGDSVSDVERRLHERLNSLHLLAAGLAIAAALLAAPLVAGPLTRPVRRVTQAARRMRRGDLGARVEPSGPAETRELAAALNRLAETLQRQDDARRDAAADTAHELRTPIAGVLSRIEAAQDGVLQDSAGNLAAMHAETLRLSRFVEDLERLADAERPDLLVEKRALDLARVAAERADAHEGFFAAKGIGFERRLEPALVRGDAARLSQVVDNLLGNALRYTESGGTVTLTVAADHSTAELAVSDTGMGVEERDLPRLFERFWRGEASRSRGTGGAGIGLAVVRQLVRAHGGEVEVESQLGRGSTFRVLLPASGRDSRADDLHRSFKSVS